MKKIYFFRFHPCQSYPGGLKPCRVSHIAHPKLEQLPLMFRVNCTYGHVQVDFSLVRVPPA